MLPRSAVQSASLAPGGQAVGDVGVIGQMEQFGVELLDLGEVEVRRGAAEGRKVEPFGERGEAGPGLDRLRGAEAGEQREQGERLDPGLAQRVDPGRAEALGQFAFGGDEQGFVGEVRRRAAERFEHLDLGRAVRDMVLAAHDVGDGEVDVVDHAGQEVEPAAVGAADDGVADQRGVELLVAADEVVPFDRRIVVEAEAPVRGDAVGDGRVGGLALVDRRQAAAEQDLAAQVEFFGGFVAGVDAARRLEPVELALVEGKALGLANDAVGGEAEPGEVGVDRVDERFGRALGVGVVDAQQELAAVGAARTAHCGARRGYCRRGAGRSATGRSGW